MPRVRLYIAASLDGFIAASDGGVTWLDAYNGESYGYKEFIQTIGAVVMGRKTYEQSLGFGPWPYGGKQTVILSSRSLTDLPPDTRVFSGDIGGLARELRANSSGDIWICGGAKTARAFLDAGTVDEIDLFVIPTLLGDGIHLFETSEYRHGLALRDFSRFPDGVVRLLYDVK